MMGISTEIILVTNSKYIEICDIFKKLKDKNWDGCSYKMTLSYCGGYIETNDFRNVIYNGEKCSLPTCIYNVMRVSESDYFMCFLGDAFIYKNINKESVEKIVEKIEVEKIDYLRIFPVIYNEDKLKADVEGLRRLSYKDRGISFVAFIASRKFIENEFANNITDYDFEVKFLRMTYCKTVPEIWRQYKIYTVDNNVFNIIPGIDKGRWERDAYNLIRKFNPEIELPKLKKIPIVIHMIRKLMYWGVRKIPTRYIKDIKFYISKLHIYKFSSKE